MIEQSTTEKAFFVHAKIFTLNHHEKWDGSGYPNGLKGDGIPLEGRVMALADVYDALVSERPYKQPMSHEKSRQIIQGDSGTHFDPALVEVFLAVEDEFKKAHHAKPAPRRKS
jgi:putative two-component system response regulator